MYLNIKYDKSERREEGVGIKKWHWWQMTPAAGGWGGRAARRGRLNHHILLIWAKRGRDGHKNVTLVVNDSGSRGVAEQQGENDLTIKYCKSERRQEEVGTKKVPWWQMTRQGGKGVAGQQGEDNITIKFKCDKSVRRKEGVGTKTWHWWQMAQAGGGGGGRQQGDDYITSEIIQKIWAKKEGVGTKTDRTIEK